MRESAPVRDDVARGALIGRSAGGPQTLLLSHTTSPLTCKLYPDITHASRCVGTISRRLVNRISAALHNILAPSYSLTFEGLLILHPSSVEPRASRLAPVRPSLTCESSPIATKWTWPFSSRCAKGNAPAYCCTRMHPHGLQPRIAEPDSYREDVTQACPHVGLV